MSASPLHQTEMRVLEPAPGLDRPRHVIERVLESGATVLRCDGRDGPDFQLLCRVHGWASPVSAIGFFGSWDACPRCTLDEREAAGRERFNALVSSGVI